MLARLLAVAAALLLLVAYAAQAATPMRFRNCATLNARYPHGVGRVGARDQTSGSQPVTTFKRSNALYLVNKGRDRDGDGIACERA